MHAYSNRGEHGFQPRDLLFRSQQSVRLDRPRPQAKRARQLKPKEIDELVLRYEELGRVNAVALEFQISRHATAKHLKHEVSQRCGG